MGEIPVKSISDEQSKVQLSVSSGSDVAVGTYVTASTTITTVFTESNPSGEPVAVIEPLTIEISGSSPA